MNKFYFLLIFVTFTNLYCKNPFFKEIDIIWNREMNKKYLNPNIDFNKNNIKNYLLKEGFDDVILKQYLTDKNYYLTWATKNNIKNIINDNYVILNKNNKKVLVYLRKKIKIKTRHIIKLSFKNLLLEQLFTLLNYNNLVGFISNNFCHCGINESNIRKSIYNDKIIYFAEKKFTRIEDGFKVKHNFKIKISKYGEIVDLNWTQLGERIEKPKMKSKKKKK